MAKILSCTLFEHNVWFAFAAVVACLIGCSVQISLYQRGLLAIGSQRLGWQFFAGKAAGLSVWATHFLAILAYEPGAQVAFDPALITLSALTAVVGAALAYGLAMQRALPYAAAAGGAALGLSFSVMHYFGMTAYRVTGLVTWNGPYVALSMVVACVFGAAALHVAANGRTPLGQGAAVALLSVAVLGVHFVGMAAFRVAPLQMPMAETNGDAFLALALAVLGVTTLVISAAVVSYLLDSEQRAESSSQLREMALRDALTGLPNRAALRAHLAQALDEAERQGRAASLVVMDLYDFKSVNDEFGEATGDDLLRLFAQRLRALAKEREFVARLNGDEFAIVQSPSGPAALDDLLTRLCRRFDDPAQLGGFSGPLRASIGAAVFPGDARDIETLLNNAELALHRARVERSPAPCFYERSMDEQVRARRKRAAELRVALAESRLELHYQKQADVADGSVRGFEALARWPLPQGGYVSPAEFIPLAEEYGVIDELGEWVLRTACREAVAWRPGHKVAVNLSPLQLAQPLLTQKIAAILAETGLPPQRLELELTESAVVRDPRQALETMRAIRALGVTMALDDFGTGHSSLAVLRRFPFDKIKLDRSFLWEIEGDVQAMAILRAVLALGAQPRRPGAGRGHRDASAVGDAAGGRVQPRAGLFSRPPRAARRADRQWRYFRRPEFADGGAGGGGLIRQFAFQKLHRLAFRHVLGDETLADSARQDEGEPAALDLLVLPHRLQHRLRSGGEAGDVLDARRQARPPADGARPARRPGPEQSPSACEKRNAQASPTATPSPCTSTRRIVVGERLQRVAEGVAEVEQRARALLGLVGGDDARLGGATDRDRARPRRPAGEHVAPCASSHSKKSRSSISPYLTTSA